MDPVELQLIMTFHQPLSVGRDEMQTACERFYDPFVARLEAHPELRLTAHFGGHLLDYLSRNRMDLLMRVKALHREGRLEILSGLFYGGLPALLPEQDIRGQLQMGFEYWESLLGEVSAGVWLPELAWTTEIPRFLSDSEAAYSFASAGQLVREDYPQRGLGVLERGGHRLAAYILDDELSTAIVGCEPDEWCEKLLQRAGGAAAPVISAWVRAERLGFDTGTHAWSFDEGWIDSFFSALTDNESIRTTLPRDSFDAVRPVTPLRLLHGCAEILNADAGITGSIDWPDFGLAYREVDTLARRMLRASDKLREAIASMEEEGLEEEWGDALATAQRLIFSAQSPDCYWRCERAGFGDPVLRSATYERLIRAEATIDALVQGDDDFISSEDDDADGDLVEEVFVANRALTAWIVTQNGGQLRALDDSLGGTALLDVPPRREEPFYNRAREAEFLSADELETRGPKSVLERPVRRDEDLPLDADQSSRCGVRDWWLDDGVSARELFSGSAQDLSPEWIDWDILRNEIDEDEDLTYALKLRGEYALTGVAQRKVEVEKTVEVPIDRPEVRWSYSVRGEGNSPCQLAIEIPLRVGLGLAGVLADDQEIVPEQTTLHDLQELVVRGNDGTVVRLRFDEPCEVWVDRVRTTILDVDGFRGVDQGLVVVPVKRVEGEATLAFALEVHAVLKEEPKDESDEETLARAAELAEEAAAAVSSGAGLGRRASDRTVPTVPELPETRDSAEPEDDGDFDEEDLDDDSDSDYEEGEEDEYEVEEAEDEEAEQDDDLPPLPVAPERPGAKKPLVPAARLKPVDSDESDDSDAEGEFDASDPYAHLSDMEDDGGPNQSWDDDSTREVRVVDLYRESSNTDDDTSEKE